MLNAEKFRDEILIEELNELNKAFMICKKNGEYFTTYNELIRWLLSEYKEPILDKVEREYLSAVCRPYQVAIICKKNTGSEESQWLEVFVDNDYWNGYQVIRLPYFKANTMYQGVKVGKSYSPQELGIKCKNNPKGEIKHD